MNDQSDLQRAMKAVDEETKSESPMSRPVLPQVSLRELEAALVDVPDEPLSVLLQQLRDLQHRHNKEMIEQLTRIAAKVNSIKSTII